MNEFLENYLNSYGGEDSYDDMFLASITAVTIGTGALAGKYVYDWEEMSFDPATGLTAALAGGRRGTYSTDGQSPALDINNKQISTFPVYAQMWFRCVGDSEPVFEFNASLNITNVSNRLYQVNISGTPTAGTFTLQITNPDATTTNTAAISYNASFSTVLSNITTALNAVLGTAYAEVGGTTWSTITVRMGDSGHTLTGGNVGSLTGASGISVSHLANGSTGWQAPITYVDNRTGVKVLNDGTLTAFPASYTQSGVVNLVTQNMGDGPKLFSSTVQLGRTYGTGTFKDTAYDGRLYVWSTYNSVAAINVVVDTSDGFPLSVIFNNGTPANSFENQLRVSEVSTDQSKWEFKSSNRAGTLAYVTLTLEQFVNGGGYLPGSVVEVKSQYNSHFRVVRTQASPGSPDWPLDSTGGASGVYEGIDGTATYGPLFAGGIFYGYNLASAIPDLDPVSGGTTLDDAITAINTILGVLRNSKLITP